MTATEVSSLVQQYREAQQLAERFSKEIVTQRFNVR